MQAVEALIAARLAPANLVKAAARIDFPASMCGSALFIPSTSSRVLSGVSGGFIVSTIGDYYIVAPNGDGEEAPVFVPQTSQDADPNGHIPASMNDFRPSSASARRRWEQNKGILPIRFADPTQWRMAANDAQQHVNTNEQAGSLPRWSHYAPVGHMLIRKELLHVATNTGKGSGTHTRSTAQEVTINSKFCFFSC
jgi:hypothetical protein